MADLLSFISRRSTTDSSAVSPTMLNLMIVLLVLLILMLGLIAALLFFRNRKRARKVPDGLPMYNEKRTSTSSTSSHRRVMIRPSESIYVIQEKQNLIDNSSNPPSPSRELPEIRITFPEEVDAAGKRQSGRVVVVRVGENGVGLEPVTEDLPAYGADERFQSLDLEKIGGLVEKARNAPSQRIA